MKVPPACPMVLLLGLCLSAGQSVPPGALVPRGYGPSTPTIYGPAYAKHVPPQQVDPLLWRRESKELLELSQAVQPDIEALSRGLLPKDLLPKLKRIEKLSKHLREEIAPLGN
jgi:hypothetical protein